MTDAEILTLLQGGEMSTPEIFDALYPSLVGPGMTHRREYVRMFNTLRSLEKFKELKSELRTIRTTTTTGKEHVHTVIFWRVA